MSPQGPGRGDAQDKGRWGSRPPWVLGPALGTGGGGEQALFSWNL